MKTALCFLVLGLSVLQLVTARNVPKLQDKKESEFLKDTLIKEEVQKNPLGKGLSPRAWDELKNKVVEDFALWVERDESEKEEVENVKSVSQEEENSERGDEDWVSWMKSKLCSLVPESVKTMKENIEDFIKQSVDEEKISVEEHVNSFLDSFFGYIDKLLSYVDTEEPTKAPEDFKPWIVNGTFSSEKQKLWYDYLYKKWKHYWKKSHRMPYN